MSWLQKIHLGLIAALVFTGSTVGASETQAVCGTRTERVAKQSNGIYRRQILERALDGLVNKQLPRHLVTHVVGLHSERGIIAIQLPEEMIPRVRVDMSRPMTRYGHGPETKNQVWFGEEEGPGANIIHADREKVSLENPQRFHVPPHTHPTDQFSVVLGGSGHFFIYRGGQWIRTPVRAGTVVFIPGNTPHTFHAGWGIHLAAVAEMFHSTEDPDFAKRSSVPFDAPVVRNPKDF